MFIRTERLLLRPAWPEDARELLDLLAEEYAADALPPEQVHKFREEISAFVSLPDEPRYPHFLIMLRDGGSTRPIGSASLSRGDGETELGYWIARQHHGQGFVEEVIRAILDFARPLGHRRIAAWRFNQSEATGRILEKCGFAPTGRRQERYDVRVNLDVPADIYAIDLAEQVIERPADQSASLAG